MSLAMECVAAAIAPAPIARLPRFLPSGPQTGLLPATKGGTMASYRLVTYAAAAGPRAGVVIEDEVFDADELTGRAGDATVLGILDDWTAARQRLGNATP